MTDDDRDHDWVDPDATRADIADHLERLARGDTLRVREPTGSLQIQRDGPEWVVDHWGTGGGWCWRERWETREVRLYLTQWDDDPAKRSNSNTNRHNPAHTDFWGFRPSLTPDTGPHW
jgi:hypothetical protein